ncbi:MAG: hypothetical protein UZ14_CFX002002197, partial [Chloroflexi bacterium OLB14]
SMNSSMKSGIGISVGVEVVVGAGVLVEVKVGVKVSVGVITFEVVQAEIINIMQVETTYFFKIKLLMLSRQRPTKYYTETFRITTLYGVLYEL